jgi:hypothetical protein
MDIQTQNTTVNTTNQIKKARKGNYLPKNYVVSAERCEDKTFQDFRNVRKYINQLIIDEGKLAILVMLNGENHMSVTKNESGAYDTINYPKERKAPGRRPNKNKNEDNNVNKSCKKRGRSFNNSTGYCYTFMVDGVAKNLRASKMNGVNTILNKLRKGFMYNTIQVFCNNKLYLTYTKCIIQSYSREKHV